MISVQRESEDRLSMQEWRFNAFSDGAGDKVSIRFAEYRTFTRPTTRHKYARTQIYSIHNKRDNDLHFTDVPKLPEVSAEARDIIIRSINVYWEW